MWFRGGFFVFACVVMFCGRAFSEAPVDRDVTIQSVSGGRAALDRLIWGQAGFPVNALPVVRVISPSDAEWNQAIGDLGLSGFYGFERVEELRFVLPVGPKAVGYLLTAKGDLNRLVLVHQGHACGFGPPGAGLQPLVKTLLSHGYSVAALYMPRPADCVNRGMVAFHEQLFAAFPRSIPDSALQVFLDPAAQTVNFAVQKRGYGRVDVIGLSGGGWATTVYAAVDPRIKLSVPVAGTRPRNVPGTCGLNPRDPEQAAIPNYYNLYVLGSVGPGRRQIQILNKYDSCCFQVICKGENLEPEIRQYEKVVQEADHKFGGGEFSVFIDADSHAHQVSPEAVQRVILPALQKP